MKQNGSLGGLFTQITKQRRSKFIFYIDQQFMIIVLLGQSFQLIEIKIRNEVEIKKVKQYF